MTDLLSVASRTRTTALSFYLNNNIKNAIIQITLDYMNTFSDNNYNQTDNILILGVQIANLSEEQIMRHIEKILPNDVFNIIFTPNPEICLKAEADYEYKQILNQADLNIPDGVGLKLGAEILGQSLMHRITGVDLTNRILEYCNNSNKKFKIYILNHYNSLSSLSLIEKTLKEKYPNILITGTQQKFSEIESVANDILNQKPDIIFSTYGAPEQEKQIVELANSIEGPKLGIGVGGTFDFITGKATRAPKWWRDLGIEWFYRLIKQPQRFSRITDATIKFPLTCYKWKKRIDNIYRNNVVGVIVKADQILLQNNRRFPGDHWQLPQGGVDDGETPEQAVIREISEELGVDPSYLLIDRKLPETHTYTWPKWAQLQKGYKGQRQEIFIVNFSGDNSVFHFKDSEEVEDIKWVKKSDLKQTMFHKRRGLADIVLKYL